MTTYLNLLKYDNYEQYLKSFKSVKHYRYLGHERYVNQVIKLGYSTEGPALEEEEFNEARKALLCQATPMLTSVELFSSFKKCDDPFLEALAGREVPNMRKKLSTIIFLQMRQRSGFDISGYIDYEDRLRSSRQRQLSSTNWPAVFGGRILLRPRRSDLSFHDWHSTTTIYNNSVNYEVTHLGITLLFKHKGDHKFIPVTTTDSPYKENVRREVVRSPIYGTVVLYDHVVRKAA